MYELLLLLSGFALGIVFTWGVAFWKRNRILKQLEKQGFKLGYVRNVSIGGTVDEYGDLWRIHEVSFVDDNTRN